MSFKCMLIKVALNFAHNSMELSSIKSTRLLPNCYSKKQDDASKLKELKNDYIVFDGSKFTYWFDKGDHGAWWDCWSIEDLDLFILEYYKDQIKGEISFYPNIITTKKIGPIHTFIQGGNIQDWNDERDRIEKLLSIKLNHYLNGLFYKCLKLVI